MLAQWGHMEPRWTEGHKSKGETDKENEPKLTRERFTKHTPGKSDAVQILLSLSSGGTI